MGTNLPTSSTDGITRKEMRQLEILLVEDSPSDVRLIREALKETPVRVKVVVATDGVEAMDYLHRTETGTA